MNELEEKASPLMDPLAPGLQDNVEISDTEKERFFKCFLSDQTYTDTVSLLRNNWKVELQALSVEQNDDVMKQIAMDQKAGIAESNDSYLIMILQYRLAQAVISINGVPFLPEITKEKYPFDIEHNSSHIKEKAKSFAKWPMYKLSALTEAFRTFEQKIQKMAQEVTNENFWKAVA